MGSILKHSGGWLVALLLLTALFAGCGESQETAAKKVEAVAEEVTPEAATTVAAVSLTAAEEALVTRIAAIAAEVEESPATAAATLEQYSLTIEDYEAEIYKIASNPAMSAAFEKAKKK